MLLSNQISQTTAAELKSSYERLYDNLKCAQNSQIRLLGEAKRRRAELEKLRAEVDGAEEQRSSKETEGEVGKLRRQLLQAYEQLGAAEEREYETQHELECLQEEKLCLEKEVQTKPAKLETETETLKDKCEDLRKEVTQRQLDVRNLMEDVETHKMLIVKEQEELEEKKKIIELKEAENARLISIPDQIIKETERKRSNWQAAVKKMEALNMEISETEQQMKVVDERNDAMRMMREEVARELEEVRAQIEACQREQRELLKKQEVSREEMADHMGTKGILELKLQNLMSDRKHLNERRLVQLREKNRQIQVVQRMEQALTIATEQLVHTKSVYSKLQAQLDAVPKREASVQQRMELQKEVDTLKVSLEKQLSLAEKESQRKQQYGMLQELLRESNRLREELHDLKCLRQIKAEERSKKHRELLRTEQLSSRLQQELREKDLIIVDHGKLNAALQRRILQYSKLCEMVTEEKNRYVRLKEIASQTITELTEQIKVLENEMEIQRTVAVSKDRSLTKAQMKVSNSSRTREKLRNDISKVAWRQDQINEQSEDNKLELTKLQQVIKLQEETLLEINRSHESAVRRRDFLGIQLLEQDEVLFSYHEQTFNLEAAITKGKVALETLEKSARELQLEINEEKRQIERKQKEVLLKRKLEEEITVLQIQLSEARDKTLESLNQTAGYKELKGKDPSIAELTEKIERLEVSLAERERQSLEKELLVEQVTRLSEPLGEQVENGRRDSLTLAKKLNEVRTSVFNASQRIMAVSAELSVTQAAALSQQQQIKEKELQMDRCQQRLEQGLPPFPEIEEEWRRMLRDKKRRQRNKEERQRLAEDEWSQLPNGVYTTAEARPDAYIPQNASLPLPKPYGALAPFKPSQPGANMRHIRKPTPKPSEMK
ncbi:coiled-coil domain-containing protein 146 isoform X3 [Austrofundulus limnaeus]|nr:PREDICTED: coiled-coil domain-containing protein 146 isoform X3 [Austrofundulus limnaeus]